MSLTHPDTPVSQQDLKDFYDKIKPYMGIYPSAIVNKFSKGDLYSTDEKMIGQWIDGKPLYQKVVGFSFSQSETTKEIDSTLTKSYIADIVGISGGYIQSDGNKVPIPRTPTSQFNGITAYVSDAGLNIVRSTNTPNGSGNINIQYTKTTDSAISIGDETDYSTEEKIVGTWIDGSPVWQKTIVITNVANVVNVEYPHGISLDTLIKVDAVTKRSSSLPVSYPFPFMYLNSSTGALFSNNSFGTMVVNSDKIMIRRGSDVYDDDIIIVTLQYKKSS